MLSVAPSLLENLAASLFWEQASVPPTLFGWLTAIYISFGTGFLSGLLTKLIFVVFKNSVESRAKERHSLNEQFRGDFHTCAISPISVWINLVGEQVVRLRQSAKLTYHMSSEQGAAALNAAHRLDLETGASLYGKIEEIDRVLRGISEEAGRKGPLSWEDLNEERRELLHSDLRVVNREFKFWSRAALKRQRSTSSLYAFSRVRLYLLRTLVWKYFN